jgi:hypothetical protein
MNCLTDEELAAVATGDPAARGDHVAGCAGCAARVAELERALANLAHHYAGRERLLAALAEEPEFPSPLQRVLMSRRSWAATAAAVAVASGLFLGVGGKTNPVALADGLKALREAKSFRCKLVPLLGGEPVAGADKLALRLVWAAPGSLPTEMLADGSPAVTTVVPHGEDGVSIDHRAKTYIRLDAEAKAKSRQEAAILQLIGGLGKFAPGDDKPAGTDEIDGVAAPRFDVKTPDPDDATMLWHARVWLHPRAGRPIRVEFAFLPGQEVAAAKAVGGRLERFEWDVRTDGLFETTPPAGFRAKDIDPTAAPDLMTPQVVAGLKAYREAVGGYPKREPFDPVAASAELGKALAGKKLDAEALKGIVLIGVLQTPAADARYHGKTVGSEDAGKILFRWKLPDGRYRAIYGDLKADTVTAERLKELEGR